MDKNNLDLQRDLLLDKTSILDAVATARFASFSLERLEDIDLSMIVAQSYCFNDQDRAGVVRVKLKEYQQKYKQEDILLNKNGTFYLNELDSNVVALTFKTVPNFLEDVIEYTKDLSDDIKDTSKEYPEIFQTIEEQTKTKIEELQEKIKTLNTFQKKFSLK
jgi:hypothetical protein